MSDGYRFIGGVLCDEDGEPYKHPTPGQIRTNGYLTLDEPDPDLGNVWKVEAMFSTTSAAECRQLAEWFATAAETLARKGQP